LLPPEVTKGTQICTLPAVKPFRWSSEKNDALRADRGISSESIVVSIEAGGLLDILTHPNQAKYPRQRVLVVSCDNYAYLVPFIDRRVNIRLSSMDLSDIRVKASEEGIPYQTLIASVLHKFVTGRLAEAPERSAEARRPALRKRRSTGRK